MTGVLHRAWVAYRMRWKRRRLLFRAFRKRGELEQLHDRSGAIEPGAILCFSTVRNERVRLPFFLDHHRKLGVGHFLFVANNCDDGTTEYLADQPDVSLWQTKTSYKASRFGLDWLTWLQIRHGHGHWCLTLDADEIFIYPHWNTRPLRALTDHLDQTGKAGLGALMMDMYPKGPLADAVYTAGADPFEALAWFDAGPFFKQRQQPLDNLWVQGGVRRRVFFQDDPRRAPTLNKIPLMKWDRRFVYVNSTHSALPPRLNRLYDGPAATELSGVLLHTKFLDIVVERSREEKERGEHFANGALFTDYYDDLAANPTLWNSHSARYEGWQQLEAMGLMSRGDWT